MKVFLWLLAIAVSGGLGFYLGIGQGAKTMAAIGTQAKVSDDLSTLRISLNALSKNDLDLANRAHASYVNSALIKLGAESPELAYWRCSDRDRAVIAEARTYIASAPQLPNDLVIPFLTRGLTFCITKSVYSSN
jgi:hypothetical protein